MTTGIQCTADPGCRYPAPPETGICHEHRRQARLPRCSARRRRGCASPPVSSPGSASPTIKPNRLRKHQCGTPKHPGPPPSPAPPAAPTPGRLPRPRQPCEVGPRAELKKGIPMPMPEPVAGRPDLRRAYSAEEAAALTRLPSGPARRTIRRPTRVSLRAVIAGLDVIDPSRDPGYTVWRPDGRSG
jgi:hypothetical protein